jgi:hypothetical protein
MGESKTIKGLEVFSLLLVAALLVGVCFRLFGVLGPLWLDEVWSIQWISELSRPFSIFTEFHTENNHFLQSLWLYALQGSDAVFAKRFFSLLCSLALLLILFSKAWRDRGWRTYHFLLVSFSYFYVLYGTEARGYAPLLLALHLVYESAESYAKESRPVFLIAFWFSCVFAALSHLSAFLFLGAVLLGMLPRIGILRATLLGVVPILSLVAMWIGYLSQLSGGSGDLGGEFLAFADLFSVGIGGPAFSVSLWGMCAFLFAIFGAGLLLSQLVPYVLHQREGWVFYFTAILLLPLCSILLYQPESLYPRHFLPALVAAYIFGAHMLDEALRSGEQRGKTIASFVLCLYLVGGSIHCVWLSVYGRGAYPEVVGLIAAGGGAVMTDHPFRHQAMLRYYAERERVSLSRYLCDEREAPSREQLPSWATLPPEEGACVEDAVDRAPPEWYLCSGPPLQTPEEVDLQHYELLRIFPAAALSGVELRLFRYREKRDATH